MCRRGAGDRAARAAKPEIGQQSVRETSCRHIGWLLGEVQDSSGAPTEGTEMIEPLASFPVIHGLDPSNHGGPTGRDADEGKILPTVDEPRHAHGHHHARAPP
jgi:hypothetical protein